MLYHKSKMKRLISEKLYEESIAYQILGGEKQTL